MAARGPGNLEGSCSGLLRHEGVGLLAAAGLRCSCSTILKEY